MAGTGGLVVVVHHTPGSRRAEELYEGFARALSALTGLGVARFRVEELPPGGPPAGAVAVVSLFALPGGHHLEAARWAGGTRVLGPVPAGVLALHAARATPPGAGRGLLVYVEPRRLGREKAAAAARVAGLASALTGARFDAAPHTAVDCGGYDVVVPLVMGPGRVVEALEAGGCRVAPAILESSMDLLLAWAAPALAGEA